MALPRGNIRIVLRGGLSTGLIPGFGRTNSCTLDASLNAILHGERRPRSKLRLVNSGLAVAQLSRSSHIGLQGGVAALSTVGGI
eukprot:4495797-Amphidinium_carterae.1